MLSPSQPKSVVIHIRVPFHSRRIEAEALDWLCDPEQPQSWGFVLIGIEGRPDLDIFAQGCEFVIGLQSHEGETVKIAEGEAAALAVSPFDKGRSALRLTPLSLRRA